MFLLSIYSCYRTHAKEIDHRRISILHADAVELAALYQSNLDHSKEIFDAGWGHIQDSKAQIASVARRVGLDIKESTLEKEQREEREREREQQQKQAARQ